MITEGLVAKVRGLMMSNKGSRRPVPTFYYANAPVADRRAQAWPLSAERLADYSVAYLSKV